MKTQKVDIKTPQTCVKYAFTPEKTKKKSLVNVTKKPKNFNI